MFCQMLAAKVSVSVSNFTVRLHFRPLAPNGEAAWRSGGGHYLSLEPQMVKFPTKCH